MLGWVCFTSYRYSCFFLPRSSCVKEGRVAFWLDLVLALCAELLQGWQKKNNAMPFVLWIKLIGVTTQGTRPCRCKCLIDIFTVLSTLLLSKDKQRWLKCPAIPSFLFNSRCRYFTHPSPGITASFLSPYFHHININILISIHYYHALSSTLRVKSHTHACFCI